MGSGTGSGSALRADFGNTTVGAQLTGYTPDYTPADYTPADYTPGNRPGPNPFSLHRARQQASASAITRSSCCPLPSAPIRTFPVRSPAVTRTSTSSRTSAPAS
jgi:hypothetical protein